MWSQLQTVMRDQAARKAGKTTLILQNGTDLAVYYFLHREKAGFKKKTNPKLKSLLQSITSGYTDYLGPYSIQFGFFSPIVEASSSTARNLEILI